METPNKNQRIEIPLFIGKISFDSEKKNKQMLNNLSSGKKNHNIISSTMPSANILHKEITFLLQNSNVKNTVKKFPTTLQVNEIEYVYFIYDEAFTVVVESSDGLKQKKLSYHEIETLAINEGFKITQQLYDACYYLAQHQSKEQRTFVGAIIHWKGEIFKYL
jgi:hypothetical protein